MPGPLKNFKDIITSSAASAQKQGFSWTESWEYGYWATQLWQHIFSLDQPGMMCCSPSQTLTLTLLTPKTSANTPSYLLPPQTLLNTFRTKLFWSVCFVLFFQSTLSSISHWLLLLRWKKFSDFSAVQWLQSWWSLYRQEVTNTWANLIPNSISPFTWNRWELQLPQGIHSTLSCTGGNLCFSSSPVSVCQKYLFPKFPVYSTNSRGEVVPSSSPLLYERRNKRGSSATIKGCRKM